MDQNDIISNLMEIGLTMGEIRVYDLLLKQGKLKVGQISKGTGLNRSNLYRILESLVCKNLVFVFVFEKTKFFSITRVDRIKELYKEKLEKFEENEKKIGEFVKNLKPISSADF